MHSAFQTRWVDNTPIAFPQAFDYGCKSFDERAFHGGVCGVNIPDMFIIEEVVSQKFGVAQALYHRVHETRVPNVPEAASSSSSG